MKAAISTARRKAVTFCPRLEEGEARLDRSPVRAQSIEQVKEIPVVLWVPQMANFVGDDVVDADGRGLH